jgi:hypothetical protein
MKIEPELPLPLPSTFIRSAPNITAQRMNRRTRRRWVIQVTGIPELLGGFPGCTGGDILPVRSAQRMNFAGGRPCCRATASGGRGTELTKADAKLSSRVDRVGGALAEGNTNKVPDKIP